MAGVWALIRLQLTLAFIVVTTILARFKIDFDELKVDPHGPEVRHLRENPHKREPLVTTRKAEVPRRQRP